METTTSEIQQKLYDSCIEQLKPMAEELRTAGWSDRRIQGVIRFHIRSKMKQYYQEKKNLTQLTDLDLESLRNKDSKAEAKFYEILKESNVKFQFQYKIGPYRADYLVGDNLVVELDGPRHKRLKAVEHDERRDSYMIKKGYHVLRLDLEVLALDPKAAIEGIKELLA